MNHEIVTLAGGNFAEEQPLAVEAPADRLHGGCQKVGPKVARADGRLTSHALNIRRLEASVRLGHKSHATFNGDSFSFE
jgi:hypothetical protein